MMWEVTGECSEFHESFTDCYGYHMKMIKAEPVQHMGEMGNAYI
jgi:hypothetical protein